MQGRLEISDYYLSCLERSVLCSFEARRGQLYDCLRALNAVALQEIAMDVLPKEDANATQAHPRTNAYENAKKLMLKALQNQMEPEIYDQFSFLHSLKLATKLKGPAGITARLEALIPSFAKEFSARESAKELEPQVGFLRWCLRTHEVGRIEPLLEFATETLFWTASVFPKSRYSELGRRLNALSDKLPG